MKPNRGLSGTLAVVFVALGLCVRVQGAPKYKVLHAFGAGSDGAGLWSSVVLDKRGDLFGTTSGGGTHKGGTAFKLRPRGGGGWAETILYDFNSYSGDGAGPFGGVTLAPSGSLYGTTEVGGGPDDSGTVFELTHGSSGWVEKILYSFGTRKDDGGDPTAGLVMDKAGNLYGTNPKGGARNGNGGTAFKLTPDGDGWQETLLHRFIKKGDGGGAYAGVILDSGGNLYGTTEGGGAYDGGAVYEVEYAATGWQEKLLHSFAVNYKDGHTPRLGALVMDASGSLYGTTAGGGCCGGVIFKLTPGSDGSWKETILYQFQGGALGFEAGAGVVMDKSGNLYGTTIAGGSECGCGVVYKLAPGSKGKWTYTVLHTFQGNDGAQPDANLILDDKGNLYGTTATGGANGSGVVFELTP